MTQDPDEGRLPTVSGPGPQGSSAGGAPQVEGYEITGQLGRGGMGTVWRAAQLHPRRPVALKLLGEGSFGSDKARARFEREVELTARLEHPNIARLYESGPHHGVYYYAMELIDGASLDRFVGAQGLSQRRVLELMATVCRAVQHAHQRGVIHRDLKPSNILVTPDGQPHVLDFGLAKTFLDEDAGLTVSLDGEVAGTPAYMSPEQARGDVRALDTRTDVYSLGVILFKLLTGEFPHDLSGPRHLALHRIAEEEARRPRQITRKVDRELEALLLKALAHEPDGRYASAGELAQDIGNYLNGNPLTAKAPTLPYIMLKGFRKYRLYIDVGALVVGALLGLAASSYHRIVDERSAAVRAQWKEEGQRLHAEWEAQRARREAEARRRALYVSRIALAEAEWRQGNIGRVKELLALCPKDLRRWEWYRLRHVHDESVLTLAAGGPAALSPDGSRVVSARDTVLVLWDLTTGRELRRFHGHKHAITSVAFAPDGSRIVSGCQDQTVRVWDVASGATVLTLPGMKAALSPDGKRIVATAAADSQAVTVWDAITGEEQLTVRHGGRGDHVRAVAWSPEGARFASCGSYGDVRVWDAQTGSKSLRLLGHRGLVLSAAFSPDGSQIASGGGDGTLRLWDAKTGLPLRVIQSRHGSVTSLAYSPDGSRLASGGTDCMVKLWETTRGDELRTFRGHARKILSLAFSPDGKRLVSSSRTTKVWDLASSKEAIICRALRPVSSAAYSPDGTRIVSGSDGSRMQIWDASTGACLQTIQLPLHTDSRSVAFSSDGNRVVAGGESGVMHVIDADTGRGLLTLRGHTGRVSQVAFSPGGRQIVSVAEDKTVRLWDAITGAQLRSLPHTARLDCVAFSPDGSRIVSGGWDGRLNVWDPHTGARLDTLSANGGRVLSVAYSPDGSVLASSGQEAPIRMWDAASGRELRAMRGHTGNVESVAFTPNGERIVSGSEDCTVKVWDVASGTTLLTLRGHTRLVKSVCFSPDGRQIASGSWDGTVRIWGSGSWEDTPPPQAKAGKP